AGLAGESGRACRRCSQLITWNFHNRVAAITGVSGGLGLSVCRALLDSGAVVHGCGLDDAALAAVSGELVGEYGADRVMISAVDVRDIARLRSWVSGISEREQRLDLLVNAAGLCATVPNELVDEALWDAILDVNLKASFFACQAVGNA